MRSNGAPDRLAPVAETERLILRHWEARDHALFRAHCSDREVERYLPPFDIDAAFVEFIAQRDGGPERPEPTFWVIERKADGVALGACGVLPGGAGTPTEGRAEIGWRLDPAHVGQGYAFEAARAVLAWAWANTDETEIVATTLPANRASRALIERLGMTRDPADDFDHPLVAEGHPDRRHILYRITRP